MLRTREGDVENGRQGCQEVASRSLAWHTEGLADVRRDRASGKKKASHETKHTHHHRSGRVLDHFGGTVIAKRYEQ